MLSVDDLLESDLKELETLDLDIPELDKFDKELEEMEIEAYV